MFESPIVPETRIIPLTIEIDDLPGLEENIVPQILSKMPEPADGTRYVIEDVTLHENLSQKLNRLINEGLKLKAKKR